MRKLTFLVFAAILASAPAAHRGTEVHISFSGVICHIFDGQHAPRAVAMRGSGHMLHHAALHMPQASVVSSDVALSCDRGDCVLELSDIELRFPGAGRARYAPGGSFDTIVPHLHTVTNGEMHTLRDDLSGVVSATMELPAGYLSATAFETRARYEPDFENRGERPFAREVFLDGTIARPELLVRQFGETSWHRIVFKDDDLIELRMINEPAAGSTAMHHETLFYELSALPLATKPVIVVPPRLTADLDVDCSNTRFP
ncbi:MAG TPA: hypothetical protein VJZ76_07670 [Thermoanaerobaculia bacterium]|nr:hypothetical protein [Thermoanaerobaculia bacterium]